MEHIESCHSIWVFDTQKMRFRRVPKGSSLDSPALETDWQSYYELEIDPSGAFAVTLNDSRTRLLRSWRHQDPCSACSGTTGEVALEASPGVTGS